MSWDGVALLAAVAERSAKALEPFARMAPHMSEWADRASPMRFCFDEPVIPPRERLSMRQFRDAAASRGVAFEHRGDWAG
jgi:hypothetical protein